jgi:large subunit ribosomal protein L18
MNRLEIKKARRARRKAGIRKTMLGVPSRPRLSVFRSLGHIYAQVIDDLKGHTLASASTREKGVAAAGDKKTGAAAVGKAVAAKAIAVGVKEVVFDRNGYRYHGRVKALADAAREGGLKF